MSRSSWAQRTGPRGRPLFSASQMGQRKCIRRWGFARLDKLDDPAGEAAEKGSAAHEEVELFEKLGKVPSTKWALRALKYAPPPGVAEVESPVRFDRWACWLGYIDLVYGCVFADEAHAGGGEFCGVEDRKLFVSLADEYDAVVIHDWKFTGSLRNAKSAEELQVDPAACIYAYEAYLGGAKRVIGRWVYIEMNDKAEVKEVWFELRRETVEAVMADLDNQAMVAERDVLEYRKGRLKVLDLPSNEDQCYAYRKQCPFFGPCHENPGVAPRARFSLSKAKEQTTMTTDFKSSMDARFPDGEKKKTPPPPSNKAAGGPPPSSKKGPPPSSKAAGGPPPSSKKPILSDEDIAAMKEQAAENVGKVESGGVNAPEADDAAPRNPEEAAAAQGAKKPEPPPPDDLDNLPGDETAQRALLKELAVKIGAVDEASKARAVGLRNAIRVHRAQHGTTYTIVDGKICDPDEAAGVEGLAEQPAGETISDEEARAEAKSFSHGDVKVSVGGVDLSGFGDGEIRAISPGEYEEGTAPLHDFTLLVNEYEEGTAPLHDFTLLVNGLLVVSDYDLELMDQNTIMRAVHEKLGINDFRFVDYGKGSGEVTCAVREMAQEGFFATVDLVYIDQRTDFGRVLVDVLSEFASTVLRGA